MVELFQSFVADLKQSSKTTVYVACSFLSDIHEQVSVCCGIIPTACVCVHFVCIHTSEGSWV